MSVIGIDPSVDHPAVAIWPAKETWQLRIEGQGAARLHRLAAEIDYWMVHNCPKDLEAAFIERPTGQFPNPVLAQANGVIQVAVIEAASNLFDLPLSVFEISPGTWKKEAIGSGRAKKEDVAAWASEFLPGMDWTQDEADALAIACAGYKLVSEEKEEA